ncbi:MULTISPECIES: TadE/TadG family type IV pilus assembly protein [Paraburkholderia]|uniref:TadE/TadG family type IV pilus assembly protein n=1 Tax=Paraburkholderia TaxID=1822464 RepID=UPI000373D1BE|nr:MULTISPECIES: TadE family protein [Paraburkholderia]MDH6152930.1 Flp pilus assembly protein TadG [Paraburkholderia sp. WSM4179]
MRKGSLRIHRMRGVVAVEFAFVAIPMVLLLLGIAEFGHAFYQYNTIDKSVRDATRMLSANSPLQADYPVAAAQCLIVYGNTGCTGSPLVNGLQASMVVVCDQVNTTGCTGQFKNVQTDPSGDTINLVQVKVTGYPYSQITGFFNLTGLIFGDISCVMRQS